MKMPFCRLCFVFVVFEMLAPAVLSAQKEVLYDQITPIKSFKKFEWQSEEELKKGEVLMIDMETVNGRKVGKIVINEPRTPFRRVAKGLQAMNNMTFPVQNDGQYTISFHNKHPLPLQMRLKIEVIRETKYKDERVLDDLVITLFEDSIQRLQIDTVPWPDLIEHEIFLTSARDLEGKNVFCITDSLLGKGAEQYAVYWIGIGDEALAAYQKIKNSPPPAWTMKGISEPLIAFGMGLTKSLPVARTPLEKNMVFQVRNPEKPIDPEKLKINDTESALFGFVSRERAKKYNAVSVCGKNFNTITGVKVYIKVARFSVVGNYVYDRVLRERVQEVFYQRPTPITPKDEK